MGHRLERLLVWLVATGTGAGMLYVAFTAPKDTASALLGVLIVLGLAVAAVGLIGFALEVVQWINRVLPDAPSVPTYQQIIDRPASAPTVPKARTFVETTPQYLTGLYSSHLDLQANKLTAPYLDHWLKVSGALGNITGDAKGGSLMVTFRRESVAAPSVYMFFRPKWREQLGILQKDQAIVVIGKISDVSALGVTLQDCELLEMAGS